MLFEARRLGCAYFIHIGVRNLVHLVLYKCYQICYTIGINSGEV